MFLLIFQPFAIHPLHALDFAGPRAPALLSCADRLLLEVDPEKVWNVDTLGFRPEAGRGRLSLVCGRPCRHDPPGRDRCKAQRPTERRRYCTILQLPLIPCHIPPCSRRMGSLPYLRESYGTVKHAVRQIYTGYLGWFQGDPVDLDPIPWPALGFHNLFNRLPRPAPPIA